MTDEVVTSAPPVRAPSRPSTARARLELLVVGLGTLVVSLTQSLLVPVLSILPADLHTSPANVEWLLTSTLLVGAVAVPFFGRLGDMYGKRVMLLVTLAALTAGSLLDAVTDNVGLLIAGRAVQGMSLAAIPLGISLLSSLLPRDRVASAIALISSMLGVGGALGLPLGGLIGEHADFHVLFWITAAAGGLALLGTVLIVPEAPNRTGGRVDVLGSAVLTAGLIALLLPLAQGSEWGWGSVRTLGLLAASAVLLCAFVALELRTRQPLVDIRATARRPIMLTNTASLMFGFALFASLIGTAPYVQAPPASGYGFGSSALVAGLCLLPSGLLMLLLAPVAARLIGSIGAHRTLTVGAVIVAVGWLLRITVTGSIWYVLLGSTVVGVGTGIGYAAMPTLINRNSPASELAAANGLNSLSRSLGSSLASAIGGSLLAISTVTVAGFELPSLAAYRALFAICAVAATGAAVIALF
ncbi:MAG TPA: MFS transporter, partial [Jatrophihabitans sp.]|nr:MFS transporter [Jatrophihabitans sp.]